MRAVLVLALLVPAVAAQPQPEWMIHVQKDGETGDLSYVPARIEATPGAVIQLMVFGEARHTMTSENGAWPEAEAYGNGLVGTAEFRAPLTPGEYAFACRYHGSPIGGSPGSGLRGTLVVSAPPQESRDEAPSPQGLALVGIALAAVLTLRGGRRG